MACTHVKATCLQVRRCRRSQHSGPKMALTSADADNANLVSSTAPRGPRRIQINPAILVFLAEASLRMAVWRTAQDLVSPGRRESIRCVVLMPPQTCADARSTEIPSMAVRFSMNAHPPCSIVRLQLGEFAAFAHALILCQSLNIYRKVR